MKKNIIMLITAAFISVMIIGLMPMVVQAANLENFNDDIGFSSGATNSFTLDGIKYTLSGAYENQVTAASFLSNDGSDGAIQFDIVPTGGLSSVAISMSDSSKFSMVGLTMECIADVDITISPNGDTSKALYFVSNGNHVNQTVDFSENLNFKHIDSIVISGGNLVLDLDDLTYNPNVPPSISNLTGGSVLFTEGGPAVQLDAGNDAVVSDSDSPDFNGGSVAVSITANRMASQDVLSIKNSGTGAGQIGVSGSNITYGGIVIGSYTGGSGTNNLAISLNANADPAAVQALVRSLIYENTSSTYPSTATRTATIAITDGDGGSSSAQTFVEVIGVNDGPTLSATGGNPVYTEGGSAVDLFSGVSVSTIEPAQTIKGLVLTVSNLSDGSSEILHIDGSDAALTNGTVITTANNSATVSVSVAGSTATVYFTEAAGISNADASTLIDSLTYRNVSDKPNIQSRTITITGISDSGGTANGGVDTTTFFVPSAVAVVDVNDAPTIVAPVSIAVAEDVSRTLLGISFSDVDAGSASVTATLSVPSGTLSAAPGVGVTNNGSGTGTLTLTGSIADINTYIAVGKILYTTAANATSNVALTVSINDGGNTGSGGSLTDTDTLTLMVTAVNDAPLITAPVSIAVAEDVSRTLLGISFSDVDAGSASVTTTLSVPSGTLSAAPGVGVTNNGSGTGTLTLTGSIADINTYIAMGKILYTTAANATSNDVLTISINDGGNTGSGGIMTDIDTLMLMVTAINDAPLITVPASISVTEDVAAALTGISFSDVDAGSSSVTATLSVPSGTLAAASGGGVAISGSDTGTLTLTGSIANINAFFAASNVTYTIAANATSNVALTVSINDGGNTGFGGSMTDTDTLTLVVSAVNDAPVITVPASISVTEDVAAALTGISFSDVDAGSGSVTATLSVPSGTLAAASGGGVTIGGTPTTLTLTGAIANINSYFAAGNVSYTTAAGTLPNINLAVTINDGGNSGSGGAQTQSTNITITVKASCLSALASVGTTGGTTKITAAANTGNSLAIKVLSDAIETPVLLSSVPAGAASYVSGEDISDVDSIINKYVALYEVDSLNRIVRFNLITLDNSKINPTAPALQVSLAPGVGPGTASLAAAVQSGNHLIIKISSMLIGVPNAGDAAPTGDGVVSPYTSGNDIVGVDADNYKYIGVYEVNGSHRVVKFKLIELYAGDISLTNAQAVALDKATLEIGYETGDNASSVTRNITLPTFGANGTTIEWTSSKPSVISDAGVVVRPSYSETDAEVTVTASVYKDAIYDTKIFDLTVKKSVQTAAEAVNLDKTALIIGYEPGDDASSVTRNITLPTFGANGTTIKWNSSNLSVISDTGAVKRPSYWETDAQVTVTASVYKADAYDTKIFDLTVKKSVQTAAEAVALDKAALEIGYATGDKANSVTRNITLPTFGANGTTIEWTSNKPSVVSASGVVIRPSYSEINAQVTVTASVYKDGVSDAKIFNLTVLKEESTGDRDSNESGGGSSAPTTQQGSKVSILIDGKSMTIGGTVNTTEANGQTTSTVIPDEKQLEELMKNSGRGAVITIPVNTNSGIVKCQFTGQIVAKMKQNEAVVELRTNSGSYRLPAQLISINDISSQFGEQVDLKDITVIIEIAQPSRKTVQVLENAASRGEFSIVAPPLEFSVTCRYGSRTINLNSFSAYIERTIRIPEGVKPDKITTGIVMNADGKISHVPTRITVVDGVYYAVINSMSNSVYSAIWNRSEFPDVVAHWSKEYVNEMGSRLIINGTDENTFAPDKAITRAEFAAIVVRALGLKITSEGDPFDDVKKTDWFSGVVSTAYSYKLLNGYSDGQFNPYKEITREEAMSVIWRAMQLVKADTEVGNVDIEKQLAQFKDRDSIGNWAKQAAASCVGSGIVSGSGENLKPGDNLTRAETAAILIRLLRKANLIN